VVPYYAGWGIRKKTAGAGDYTFARIKKKKVKRGGSPEGAQTKMIKNRKGGGGVMSEELV